MLGFKRFVQTFGVAAAWHFAAGELVHDDDFALAGFRVQVDDVVHFAVEERVRLDRLVEHRLHFLQLRFAQASAPFGRQAKYSVDDGSDGFVRGLQLRLFDDGGFFIGKNVAGQQCFEEVFRLGKSNFAGFLFSDKYAHVRQRGGAAALIFLGAPGQVFDHPFVIVERHHL